MAYPTRQRAKQVRDAERDLPRPTEEEYFASASGRAAYGILEVTQTEGLPKGAVSQVECVAWGWTSRPQAECVAAFANYLMNLEDKKKAMKQGWVAVGRLPVTVTVGKKEMAVLPDYIQLTNKAKWLDELTTQFRDYVTDATLVKMQKGAVAMARVIKPDIAPLCTTREVGKKVRELGEYASKVAMHTTGSKPLPPAPHFPKLWESTLFPKLHTMILQQGQEWAEVAADERALMQLIAHVKHAWPTLPLSMITPVDSMPVYPPGVSPPDEEDDDDEVEGEEDDDDEDEEEAVEDESDDAMVVDAADEGDGDDEKGEEEEDDDEVFTD